MKRPFFLVTLEVMLAGLVALGLSDNAISIAHTSTPDNEVTSSEANNSSATATITVTMTGVVDE